MSEDKLKLALDELAHVSNVDQPHVIAHYLYFPKQYEAKKIAEALRSQGFQTEERLDADGTNWLVLAKHKLIPSEENLKTTRDLMEQLASKGQGEYDGWEAEVTENQTTSSHH